MVESSKHTYDEAKETDRKIDPEKTALRTLDSRTGISRVVSGAETVVPNAANTVAFFDLDFRYVDRVDAGYRADPGVHRSPVEMVFPKRGGVFAVDAFMAEQGGD